MRILKISPLFLFFILLIGCSSGQKLVTSHYILEYLSYTEDLKLIQETPIPHSVQIMDTKIPSMYDRKQIVVRHFGPRITYNDENVWASNLTDIVPQLIATRINRYQVFRLAKRDFLSQRPDYEIHSRIDNIEVLSSENYMQARLNMEISLRMANQEKTLARHSFDRQKNLVSGGFEDFVQSINEMILAETDIFILKTLAVLKEGQELEDGGREKLADSYIERIESENDTTMSGILVLPNLSRSDNEPYFKVLDENLDEIGAARMGEQMQLPAGKYTVLYGSGAEDQMMIRRDVMINPRYKTVLEPDWGALTVTVMTPNRDYIKARYELFSSATGESFGSEIPPDLEQGEQQKVWILKPGHYKITINNEPFNAYQDFATVFLEPGKAQEFKIIVNTDDEGNPTNLIGAGILDESETYKGMGNWRSSRAIHGNISYTKNNESDENDPVSNILLNTQFDNRMMYRKDRVHFSHKSLIELEAADGNKSDFRISYDEIDLKNTLVYYVLGNIGFYTRFDLESHIFPGNEFFETKQAYIKIDLNGDTAAVNPEGATKIQTKDSFYPLVMKEGIGLNLRILNKPKATLNLRSGFGIRQDIYKNTFARSETSGDFLVYRELKSEHQQGTELSLVGNFRLPLGLTYSVNADVLIPFDKSANKVLEMENDFNIRLLRYISIDYKLRLKNKVTDDGSYISEDHKLFLRWTYFLR
jgi:ABC-type uncharacterized transport system auxiliary subunit